MKVPRMRRPLAVLALALTSGALSRPAVVHGQATAADSADRLASRADSVERLRTEPDLREAIDLSTRAAVLYQLAGRRGEAAQRLHNIGRAYKDLGQLDSALSYDRRALAVRRELGDRRGEGATLGAIGNAHLGLEHPDSAL